MEKATIIGIDLAKRVFQVHAASKDGLPILRKKVSRAQFSASWQAAADYRGDGSVRDGTRVGTRDQRSRARRWLDPPIYVKPFVRRQKNDAADAEAIAEAASRLSNT